MLTIGGCQILIEEFFFLMSCEESWLVIWRKYSLKAFLSFSWCSTSLASKVQIVGEQKYSVNVFVLGKLTERFSSLQLRDIFHTCSPLLLKIPTLEILNTLLEGSSRAWDCLGRAKCFYSLSLLFDRELIDISIFRYQSKTQLSCWASNRPCLAPTKKMKKLSLMVQG